MNTSEVSKVTGVSNCWICKVFRGRRVDVIEKGGVSGYRSHPVRIHNSNNSSPSAYPVEDARVGDCFVACMTL
jgi:hypothetical protein